MAGKGYNAMNVWAKNSTDKKWSYGFADHLWGINWTAAMINDPLLLAYKFNYELFYPKR